MSKAIKSNWCIVGRIPYQENEVGTFNDMTEKQANSKFVDLLYSSHTAAEREETIKNNGGETAYLDFILRSDSPIEIAHRIW